MNARSEPVTNQLESLRRHSTIVADTGGLREVVAHEKVGLRFNGGDAEHLAFMVERMLTDHELRDRLVTQAGEHVLRFDWADIAVQTAEIYRRVAAACPAPAAERASARSAT